MALQLVDLLTRGYFPRELPPSFSTSTYGTALAVANPGNGAFNQAPKHSSPCVHNLVRSGGLRRNLSIPNPKHFYRLAAHVVAHWTDYSTFANQSPFSLTKPTVGTSPQRAITSEHDLDERTLFRAELRAQGKYVLKTDVSRFFPSIYTHSLPWATMGKATAKAAHTGGTLANTWQDKGDALTRGIISNQTIGIPIGPDTSRLFAEVILARIDIELRGEFPHLAGIRYIDDYEFACQTRAEAESVLSKLQHQLNEFELAVNASKTAILEMPEPLENPWISELRTFAFRSRGVAGQRYEITRYFDRAFSLVKTGPDEGLLKYAIARLNSLTVDEDNWELYENILCQCALVEPACLPQVCDQLVFYESEGMEARQALWTGCLNRIVLDRLPLGHSSEAAWAMWIMKFLNVQLAEEAGRAVGGTEDSIAGLMGLGLADSGLADKANLAGLDRFHAVNEVFGPQWLLFYEGNLKSWLGTKSKPANLATDAAFEFMRKQGVSFFDITVAAEAPDRPSYAGTSGGSGGSGGWSPY